MRSFQCNHTAINKATLLALRHFRNGHDGELRGGGPPSSSAGSNPIEGAVVGGINNTIKQLSSVLTPSLHTAERQRAQTVGHQKVERDDSSANHRQTSMRRNTHQRPHRVFRFEGDDARVLNEQGEDIGVEMDESSLFGDHWHHNNSDQSTNTKHSTDGYQTAMRSDPAHPDSHQHPHRQPLLDKIADAVREGNFGLLDEFFNAEHHQNARRRALSRPHVTTDSVLHASKDNDDRLQDGRNFRLSMLQKSRSLCAHDGEGLMSNHLLIIKFCAALLAQCFTESQAADFGKIEESLRAVPRSTNIQRLCLPLPLLFPVQLQKIRQVAGGASLGTSDDNSKDPEHLLWQALCDLPRGGTPRPGAQIGVRPVRAAFISDWEIGATLASSALQCILAVISLYKGANGISSEQFQSLHRNFHIPYLVNASTNDGGGAFLDILSFIDSYGLYMESSYKHTLQSIAKGASQQQPKEPAHRGQDITEADFRLLLSGCTADSFVAPKVIPIYGSFVNVALNATLETVLAKSRVQRQQETFSPTVDKAKVPIPFSSYFQILQSTLKAFAELGDTMRGQLAALEQSARAADDEAAMVFNGSVSAHSGHRPLHVHRPRQSASRFDITDEAPDHNNAADSRRVGLRERSHALSVVLPFGSPCLSPQVAAGVFQMLSAVPSSAAFRQGRGRDDLPTAHVSSMLRKLMQLVLDSSKSLTELYSKPPTAIVQRSRKAFHSHRDPTTGAKQKRSYLVRQRVPLNYSVLYLASLRRGPRQSTEKAAQLRAAKAKRGGQTQSGSKLEDLALKLLSSDRPIMSAAGEDDSSPIGGIDSLDPSERERSEGIAGMPLASALSLVEKCHDQMRIHLYVPPSPELLKQLVKAFPVLYGLQSAAIREKFLSLGATGVVRQLDSRSRRLLPTTTTTPILGTTRPVSHKEIASNVFESLFLEATKQYRSPLIRRSHNSNNSFKFGTTAAAAAAMEGTLTSHSVADCYDPGLEMPIIDESDPLAGGDNVRVGDAVLSAYVAEGKKAMTPVIVKEWAAAVARATSR